MASPKPLHNVTQSFVLFSHFPYMGTQLTVGSASVPHFNELKSRK